MTAQEDSLRRSSRPPHPPAPRPRGSTCPKVGDDEALFSGVPTEDPFISGNPVSGTIKPPAPLFGNDSSPIPPPAPSPVGFRDETSKASDSGHVAEFPVSVPRPVSKPLPPAKEPLEIVLKGKTVRQVCQLVGAHLEDVAEHRAEKVELSPTLWSHLTTNSLRMEAMHIIQEVDSFKLNDSSEGEELHDMLVRRALGFVFISLTATPAGEFCLYRRALAASLEQMQKA